MREKSGYRANLERLDQVFPEKDGLTVNDVAKFLGRHPRTVKKKIQFNPVTGLVTKADLARQVAV